MWQLITIENILVVIASIYIFLSTIKGYKKDYLYYKYNVFMYIVFWIIYLVTSQFINVKNILLYFNLFEKIELILFKQIINLKALEEVVIFICNTLFKIVYLLLLILVFPLIKKVIKKIFNISKEKEINKNKSALFAMFKASINSFIVLCIINSVFISVPKLNDDSNAFISDYCISITNENKYVKKALELLAVYQDSTLCNITSFKINNYQVDTQIFDVLFAEKTFKSLRKDVEILSDVSIKIYETIDNFENIDLNKIKYIVDKLTSVENIDNIAVILITILFSYESYLDEIDDSIKTYYQSINYQNELETISNLLDIVKQYKVNYKKEYLKEISIKLYSLKSINLLGYFSCCYLFNTYFKDQSKLINIKEKIASYAINNKFNEDILLVDELYLYFLDLADIKNISTFLYVCMKSNFVNYILIDVIYLIKDKLEYDYASLINPSINTCEDVIDDVNTLLYLINNVGENMDFSLLKRFDINKIVESDVLSYALIKLLIDASENKGLLKKYGSFICIDKHLKQYDENTNRFHENWYKNNGELFSILSILKDVLVNLDGSLNTIDNIINIVKEIDESYIVSSDVIYKSINKLLFSNLDSLCFDINDVCIEDNNYLIKKDVLLDLINCIKKIDCINYKAIVDKDYENILIKSMDYQNQIKLLSNNDAISLMISYFLNKFLLLDEVCINKTIICYEYANNDIKEIKINVLTKQEIINILNLLFSINIQSDYKKMINKENIEKLSYALTYNDSRYCYLLHLNLSLLVINYLKTINDIDISNLINKYEKIIDSNELIALLNSLCILNEKIDITKIDSIDKNELVNVILSNNEILNSLIIKEIVIKYSLLYS